MKPAMWEVFLHVVDVAPGEDGVVAEAPAVGPAGFDREGALVVLRRVRGDVLPFVRMLERAGVVKWSYLIHDRSGGVPVGEDDRGAYVHLRFASAIGARDLRKIVREPWFGLRRMPAPACVDRYRELMNWMILSAQSEIVALVLERHADLDGDELLQQVGQFLHMFANMTQLPHPWLLRAS